MTGLYNFKAEVLIKYDQEVYDNFIEMFDMLPIACVINNNFFCVHGGISD
jgi:serine/threonine-protein phosphatase 2B catalytic subunit